MAVTSDRSQAKVWLRGIDASPAGQDFGTRAKQARSDLAHGRTVSFRTDSPDRYGRTVAEVLLPDGR
jgi:endonuclease YncB( thermonuclease family)